jgi:hypothetical protein
MSAIRKVRTSERGLAGLIGHVPSSESAAVATGRVGGCDEVMAPSIIAPIYGLGIPGFFFNAETQRSRRAPQSVWLRRRGRQTAEAEGIKLHSEFQNR